MEEGGWNREDGGRTQWKRGVTVNDAKVKTYLNVGDGQVNVSPCRIIAPFENKNQLDFKSQKILDEERRSRKIHERKTRKRQKPTERYRNRKQGRQRETTVKCFPR